MTPSYKIAKQFGDVFIDDFNQNHGDIYLPYSEYYGQDENERKMKKKYFHNNFDCSTPR